MFCLCLTLAEACSLSSSKVKAIRIVWELNRIKTLWYNFERLPLWESSNCSLLSDWLNIKHYWTTLTKQVSWKQEEVISISSGLVCPSVKLSLNMSSFLYLGSWKTQLSYDWKFTFIEKCIDYEGALSNNNLLLLF